MAVTGFFASAAAGVFVTEATAGGAFGVSSGLLESGLFFSPVVFSTTGCFVTGDLTGRAFGISLGFADSGLFFAGTRSADSFSLAGFLEA